MTKPIIFDKARISSVEHKIANGGVTSKIKVHAIFTPAVATAMEARWLFFDKEKLATNGYKAIELDYELKNIRMTFEVPKMEGSKLELTSESATGFKVMRQGDGKKKPKRLAVQFKIAHAGSPFDLLEYILRISGAEGQMSIEALQQEMFAPQEETPAKVALAKAKDVGKRLKRDIAAAQKADNVIDMVHPVEPEPEAAVIAH